MTAIGGSLIQAAERSFLRQGEGYYGGRTAGAGPALDDLASDG
jgi:hypothetical protein